MATYDAQARDIGRPPLPAVFTSPYSRGNANVQITKKSFVTALSAVALAIPALAVAQDRYPSKPITIIVPYAAGGSSDTRSRQLAQHMSETLGVPVVVENRPGASGNIGTSQIARSNPDGYTIG